MIDDTTNDYQAEVRGFAQLEQNISGLVTRIAKKISMPSAMFLYAVGPLTMIMVLSLPTPHVFPRKPRARPILLPVVPLLDEVEGARSMLVLPEPGAGVEADDVLPPLDTHRYHPFT